MTKTNFEKLVRWDADYYKELTDDDCIVCLTEREVYIVGQIIDMIRWSRTRWIGDLLGLDFDLIAGNLEYKLAERMTCQNVTTLLQKITELEQKIDYVFNETAINEGDTDIIYNPETTVIDDVHTPEELADFGVQADVCDTSGKDAVYGAVNQLVRYIVQRNIDFLEQVNQAGNTPDQIARVVSAIPGVGSLPIDEIFDWVSFISEELEDEYNATVDEALIQQVVCDLFCIAVASGCTLDFNDVYNYFASKVSATFSNAATTFLNLVQFGINGTFSGDDYFYYMCYFQITTVGLGQFYLGTNSLNDYAYQARAGMNSPDNDWSIFCIACPQMYRIKTYDFAMGLHGATLIQGTQGGEGLIGVDIGTSYAVEFTLPMDPTWRVEAVGWREFRAGGTSHGSLDSSAIRLREIVGSNTDSHFFGGGFMPNGEESRCFENPIIPYMTDLNEIYFFGNVRDVDPSGGAEEYKLYELVIMYDVEYAPVDAVITTQTPTEFVTDCL
jgi:hypothetical protein